MPATRIPLLSGTYQARNVIAAAQVCRNLYLEKNPQGEDSPTTHLLTPGLTRLGLPPEVGTVRGLYPATSGALYAAIGASLYVVTSSWTFINLGTIGSGNLPVGMGDNGTTMVVVDGSSNGWTVDLTTNTFAAISDPNFYGSNFVADLDTYLLFNKPNTGIFYSSDSNSVTFDPLYFATKSGYSDKLSGLIVCNRLMWLIGSQASTELWSDVGAADFPFQLFSGPFVEHGTVATYSIAKYASAVFWLGTDQKGNAFVLQGENLRAIKISNPAIDNMLAQAGPLNNAIAFTYEQQGHAFYWLKLPEANNNLGLDLLYDITTDQWHERSWMNPGTCQQEGHRAFCQAFCYGINIVGDRETGQLYMLDLNNQTDNGAFIERRRGWPHMMTDGSRLNISAFIADMQAGTSATTQASPAPPAELAPPATFPQLVTVIDTTFNAPNGTLLQDYFYTYGYKDIGSQYTQIVSGTNAEIEAGALTGVGSGEATYLASGQPTSPDYIAQFEAIPASYSGYADSSARVFLIGRSDTAGGTGYEAAVTGGTSSYYVTLTIIGGATYSVALGSITSGEWTVYLSMQGTAISVAVQRTQDSLWVAPDGTWQADFTTCIAITDGTYTATGTVVIGGVW